MRIRRQRLGLLLLLLAATLLLSGCSIAGRSNGGNVSIEFGAGQATDTELANSLQIMLLLTGLALVPTLLIVTTAFVRIVIVLSVVRSAIGLPQLPPNQVVIGLALILTFFVMRPAIETINGQALQPFLHGEVTQQVAIDRATPPMRDFMFRQVRNEDLALFLTMAKMPRPNDQSEVPTSVLIPAFLISELRTAFQMAFVIYIPFLVIDMVVSSALLSMGMMMLPPTVVSLPFKLLLFVLVDGWHLIAQSLVQSFR
jgi:flagellar biosynthesis protein FliP